MTPREVLVQVVEFCHHVTQDYLDDLNDADLLVRSVPGSNHIAWQLGHLIISTRQMLQALGHAAPELPPRFEVAHTTATAAADDPGGFFSKAEYLRLKEVCQAATRAAIEATPEDQLAAPGPESMRTYAPTVAAVLSLLGTHWLMHAGQFVPIRRKLGRAPLY
ncbi:MAG: DinB family protein [Phycisphaerales bacterium]|nr:DinB family protein [Phycisphaerales bacterium]